MNRIRGIAILSTLAAAFVVGAPPGTAAGAAIVADEVATLARTQPETHVIAWIRFTDRAGAEHSSEAIAAERARRPARSLERRALRGADAERGITADDLPVHAPYLRAVEARGLRVRGASRWRNAVSVEGPAAAVADLGRLPFVAAIEPVARARGMRPVEGIEAAPAMKAVAPATVLAPGDSSFYGATFKQLSMMLAPQAHAAGWSGNGVLVCVLDSGFRTTHAAFSGLSIVATRDFVHGDANVDDEPGQDSPGAGTHGTMTLACIAGLKPGTYVGGAFGAAVALGKTEDVADETPVEMDYWQFGAEWADSLGADVISASLGYFAFDSPFPSYSPADMDGRTTTVTRAASMAMRRGIVVVTAIGNERGSTWNYLIAPADADTVISAGAVDSFNVLAPFSSPGPTADGRIKPDVTAMGRRVYVPVFTDNVTYARVSGTSFSTPLTAAMAALLLEAHPTWDPFTVREALRETALGAATPDPDIGWGLIQMTGALAWTPSTTDVAPPPIADRDARGLALSAGPNPFTRGGGSVVRFAAPGRATLDAFDARGRHVTRLFEGDASAGASVTWRGEGATAPVAPGVYWLRLGAPGSAAVSRTLRVVVTR